MRIWGLLTVLGFALVTGGCSRDLPRDTPEATIASARTLVMEGRADRLGEFFYSDTPEMKLLLEDMGLLLGHLQDLGRAVQTRFPDEVAKLKAEAQASAASGKSSGFLAQITQQVRPGRRPSPQQGDQARSAFDDALKQLFADPYGWLESAEGKLSTEEVSDDTVAVLYEGKPVLAPLGLTMKQDSKDDQWYFVLPTGAPGLNSFMPKSPEQYDIFGSVLATFDNVVRDLTKDVENGRVGSLDQLSKAAGEKAFIPVVMTVFAYTKATDAQKKEARAADKAAAPKTAPKTAPASGQSK